jgi:flagellar biosynthesis/type III secretory pathway protein FliH
MQVETLEETVPTEDEGILSQQNFLHAPFRETAWEIIGERIPDNGFVSLEIDVLPSEMTKPDPMFRDFGGGVSREEGKVAHAGQSLDDVDVGPVIDEAMLERIRAEAYEEGKQAGMLEGREVASVEGQDLHQQLVARFEDFRQEVLKELLNLAARTEKNALELALSVSKKILLTTADVRADYILDVIRNALHSVGAGNPLKIRVSPQDHEFLKVIGLPPELSSEETGVQYVADDGINSGCVVETDFGEIDLRLDHMWQQVRENLYEVLK